MRIALYIDDQQDGSVRITVAPHVGHTPACVIADEVVELLNQRMAEIDRAEARNADEAQGT